VFFCIIGFRVFTLWMRNKDREKISVGSVLLQVSMPRDNEIKVDAAEQLFAGLAAFHKSKKRDYFKHQTHISFEIVGMPGDIRFYINVPANIRDYVEKQINGSYPDAEIVQVNDPAAKQKDGNTISGGVQYFFRDR